MTYGTSSHRGDKPRYTDQRWSGTWPLTPGGLYPADDIPVVYFLYGTDRKLSYIGSTGHFLNRMKAHEDTKTWVRWSARCCHTRHDAYQLESIEITHHTPPLNKPRRQRRGHEYVQEELRRRKTRAQYEYRPLPMTETHKAWLAKMGRTGPFYVRVPIGEPRDTEVWPIAATVSP